MAQICFLAPDQEWTTASYGCPPAPIARHEGFSARVVKAGEAVVIVDARHDPELARHPLVAGPAGVRFCAGAPLVSSGGEPVGAVCVMDTRERNSWSEQQGAGLAELAALVSDLLRMRAGDRLRLRQLEALGQQTARTAHDLKNMLVAVAGNSDLLRLEIAESDPLRETVEDLAAAAGRASELARRLTGYMPPSWKQASES